MTRKDLIIDKYLILKKNLKNIVFDNSVFQWLKNYLFTDINFGLNYYFSNDGENNYADTIDRLIKR